MEYSLSAAAKAVGKGKSTIHNAIKSGKLSARRADDGSYQIDASELARVFTLNPFSGSKMDDPELPHEPPGSDLAVLQVKVSMLEDQLHRERETARDTIEDLRKRLDRAEERVYLLTHQATQESPKDAESLKAGGVLRWLLGR